MTPVVSIIIPSFNGAHKIVDCLNLLRAQNQKNFEVIVVIDGSTDNTEQKISGLFIKEFPLNVIHQLNAGRAQTRNIGVKHANSDLLIFLDDDMLPDPEFVEKHSSFHQTNANSILIGNGYRNPNASNKSFYKYLIEEEKKWQKNLSGEPFDVQFDSFIFTACNMSLPRNLFQSLGGFDSRLTDGEDFQFGAIALKKKIKITFNRNVIAWHNDSPDIRTYIKRHQEYISGRKQLLFYYPENKILFPTLFNNLPKSNFLKNWLIKGLRSSFFLNFTGSSIFEILPESLKFTFYNFIIAAHTFPI